jgi:hypothetical protein
LLRLFHFMYIGTRPSWVAAIHMYLFVGGPSNCFAGKKSYDKKIVFWKFDVLVLRRALFLPLYKTTCFGWKSRIQWLYGVLFFWKMYFKLRVIYKMYFLYFKVHWGLLFWKFLLKMLKILKYSNTL